MARPRSDPEPDPAAPSDDGLPGLVAPVGSADGIAPAADGADDVRYTIDELAGISGVPSRTIRFYQSSGTLPSPEKRGRVAYYGPAHVERLRMIADLQDRGLRLDAIRGVLDQIEHGRDSLHGWLGFGDELQAPWLDERPGLFRHDELEARFDIGRPGFVARLERAGIIVRQGNTRPATYVVPSPALLEIAIKLESGGVDLEVSIEAAEIIRRRLSRAAEELVPFFAEAAGRGFGHEVDPKQIAAAYQAVRHIGMQAVQVIFAQEMERALRRFVESGQVLSPPRAGRTTTRERGDRKDRSDAPDRSRRARS